MAFPVAPSCPGCVAFGFYFARQRIHMNKAPAFQFYPKDFLTDCQVASMPLECLGIYIKLLCYDWIENGIPAEQKTWKRIVGYAMAMPPDCDPWKEYADQLSACFQRHPSKRGFLTNKRLWLERAKQDEYRKSQQVNALTRWKPPMPSHSHRNAKLKPSQCFSSSFSSSKKTYKECFACDGLKKIPESEWKEHLKTHEKERYRGSV